MPNKTRLLLTHAPGKWHSTHHSCPNSTGSEHFHVSESRSRARQVYVRPLVDPFMDKNLSGSSDLESKIKTTSNTEEGVMHVSCPLRLNTLSPWLGRGGGGKLHFTWEAICFYSHHSTHRTLQRTKIITMIMILVIKIEGTNHLLKRPEAVGTGGRSRDSLRRGWLSCDKIDFCFVQHPGLI